MYYSIQYYMSIQKQNEVWWNETMYFQTCHWRQEWPISELFMFISDPSASLLQHSRFLKIILHMLEKNELNIVLITRKTFYFSIKESNNT